MKYWIPQAARYRAPISRQEQINARIEATARLAELQEMQERQAGIAVLALMPMVGHRANSLVSRRRC